MNKKNQNFISSNKKVARSSFGLYFSVGEEISHQDEEAGTATILRFEAVHDENEVTVHTSKGHCHLDFCEKIEK